MIRYFKTIDNVLVEIKEIKKDCWINVVNPKSDEFELLTKEININSEFLKVSLDEEERSHVDLDKGQKIVIVDVPLDFENNKTAYSTIPLSIIITEDYIITVCLSKTSVISQLINLNSYLNTNHKTQMLLKLLYRTASAYLKMLKTVGRVSDEIEKNLHKSQRNKELFQMLSLEKSLVYLSTSLKANESTIEKISRGQIIKIDYEDREILDDVSIEIKQAIEMCNIYSRILSGITSSYASIISNNLNIVMKILTSITILMTIPNTIFGFYGMNVNLPYPTWIFAVIIALITVLMVAFILWIKKMF
ncbi:MAG: magnesium transporter CorA family protein [Clostridiales bacterium]|nr:magnesium transporter CorA family protein [Clostridiales bacterium]